MSSKGASRTDVSAAIARRRASTPVGGPESANWGMRNSLVAAQVFWFWLCDEKFSSMRMHVTCDQRARTWWGRRCYLRHWCRRRRRRECCCRARGVKLGLLLYVRFSVGHKKGLAVGGKMLGTLLFFSFRDGTVPRWRSSECECAWVCSLFWNQGILLHFTVLSCKKMERRPSRRGCCPVLSVRLNMRRAGLGSCEYVLK